MFIKIAHIFVVFDIILVDNGLLDRYQSLQESFAFKESINLMARISCILFLKHILIIYFSDLILLKIILNYCSEILHIGATDHNIVLIKI